MSRYRTKKIENLKKNDLVRVYGKIEHIDNYEYKSKKGEVYKVLINVLEKNQKDEYEFVDVLETIAFLNYQDRKYKEVKELFSSLNKGDGVIVDGRVGIDETYHKIIIPSVHVFTQIPTEQITIDNIKVFEFNERKEESEYNRVEFQVTTKWSTQQSIVDVNEYVEMNKKFGNDTVVMTDRGVAHGYPEFESVAKKNKMKAIYGVEIDYSDKTMSPYITDKRHTNSEKTYIVFDIETTGLEATFNDLIELGAVKIKDGKVIDEFQYLIKPSKPINDFIIGLTGITNEMLEKEGRESEEEVLKEFKEFVGNNTLVGHNATFDYNFIQQKTRKYKTNFNFDKNPVVDTLKMSRFLFQNLLNTKKRAFSLDVMVKEFELDFEGSHHRAKDDALMTYKVFEKLMNGHKNNKKEIEGFNDLGLFSLEEIHQKGKKYIDNHFSSKSKMLVYTNNQKGRKSLYQLISLLHTTYSEGRVLPLDEIIKRRENLTLISSGYKTKEIYANLINGKANKDDWKMFDVIGIQPTSIAKLDYKDLKSSQIKQLNKTVIKLAEQFNIPVIAIGGVHYLNKGDVKYHKVIANEGLRSGLPHLERFIKSEKYYKNGEEKTRNVYRNINAYFRTTKEMLDEFNYLGKEKSKEIVVDNTLKLADKFDEIYIVDPKLYAPHIEGTDEIIREKAYKRLKEKYGKNPDKEIIERLEDELKKVIEGGFGVIYYISSVLIEESLKDGYLVGSRGSVGSSFLAHLINVTELNPLPTHYLCDTCKKVEWHKDVEDGYDLEDKECECGGLMVGEGGFSPYAIFGGFDGSKVPDIDMNFANVYQHKAHQKLFELVGKDKSYRAGTVGTYSEGKVNKSIWDMLKKVGKKEVFLLEELYRNDNNFFYKDKITGQRIKQKNIYGKINHIVIEQLKEKGSKGNKIRIVERETFKIKDGYLKEIKPYIEGVKYGTGIHAGGIILIPQGYEIEDFTPIQYGKDGRDRSVITTHFDFHSLHDTLVKEDVLGHTSGTILSNLEKETGVNPKTVNIKDKKVLEEIGKGHTEGLPEFNTRFSTQVVLETKPKIVSDFIKIMSLTHGTGVYLQNNQDLILKEGKKLSDVITSREDMLKTLVNYGLDNNTSFKILEFVRKGKFHKADDDLLKQWYEWKELMIKKDVPLWYIESMEKIQYLFPRQHAKAYTVDMLRFAYYRYYHLKEFTKVMLDMKANSPVFFLPTILDKDDFNKFVGNIEKRMDDPKQTISNKEKDSYPTYRVIQYFKNKGYEILPVDLNKSANDEFLYEENGLRLPLSVMPNISEKIREGIINLRKEKEITSIIDLKGLTNSKKNLDTIKLYCGLK